MLRLERIDADRCDWQQMDAFRDRVLFQTREWVSFIASTQQAEPVIAEVKDESTTVGFYTGLMVRRYGVRILGSPFPGWTTLSMGFNLAEGVPRRLAVDALPPFAFKSLGCVHMELKDRHVRLEDVAGLGFEHTPNRTFELDLAATEEEMLARMTSACRRNIRKAEKVGVVLEEAVDLEFAEDYYIQLQDVFAKQSLAPTYGIDRVRELIRHVHPTGRLLLVRARDPEGRCVATGIFPAMNGTAYFWGGASWREHQILRPNEAVFWFAMNYWKRRGMTVLDMGGGGDYKRKYGPTEFTVPFFRKARIPGLLSLRNVAQSLSERGWLR